jgi:hypothetical protein
LKRAKPAINVPSGDVSSLTVKRIAVALTSGLDQPPGDVAGDFERLGNRSPLSNQAGKFIRSRKEKTFGQWLDLNPNRQFHMC